jgi:hypothetical protein
MMDEYLLEMKTGLYLMEGRKSREGMRMSGEDGRLAIVLIPTSRFADGDYGAGIGPVLTH